MGLMEIWGHRGAYDHAPENTLTGFQLAVNMDADGVEFDVQLTRDNELVVIHDETVDRTSNGSGYVKDFTLSELKKLNFNKKGITNPKFMEIPTLAEVFELLKPRALTINVELKTGVIFYEGIEALALETARKYDILDRIVWSSFNHFTVQKVKQLEPQAETALLCSGEIFVTGEQCEKTGASALHPHIKQLNYPDLIKDCHSRGIKVRTWTVNEPEQFEIAKDSKVDVICTNRIDAAIKELRGYDNR